MTYWRHPSDPIVEWDWLTPKMKATLIVAPDETPAPDDVRCQAVAMGMDWVRRCGFQVYPGHRFCPQHGGPDA